MEKISDTTYKEITQVETVYDVNDIKAQIDDCHKKIDEYKEAAKAISDRTAKDIEGIQATITELEGKLEAASKIGVLPDDEVNSAKD